MDIITAGLFRIYPRNKVHLWVKLYDDVKTSFQPFAEDAFGLQFVLVDRNVGVFQPETAELEMLWITKKELYRSIFSDPELLSWSLYQNAVLLLGLPSLEQHFAFKVELALGGLPVVDNITIIDSIDHFGAMSSIARQIRDIPIGTIIRTQ